MDAELLQTIVDWLNDILSSGQDGELSDWHKEEIQDLFNEHGLTADDLKEVFHAYYVDTYGVTFDEVKWMMKVCGVSSFTITI